MYICRRVSKISTTTITTTPIQSGGFIPIGAGESHEAGMIRTHPLEVQEHNVPAVPRRLRFISPQQGTTVRSDSQFVPIARLQSSTTTSSGHLISKPDFLATVTWLREELYRTAGLSMGGEVEPPTKKHLIEEWKKNVRLRCGTKNVSIISDVVKI